MENSANGEYIGSLPKRIRQNPAYEGLVRTIEAAIATSETESMFMRVKNMRRILLGRINPSAEEYAAAGIDATQNAYRVALFTIDDYTDMFFDESGEGDNIDVAHACFRACIEYYAVCPAVVSCGYFGGNIVAVFCFDGGSDSKKNIVETIHKTFDFIEENYGLEISGVLSREVSSVKELSFVFKECISQMELKQIIHSEVKLITNSDQVSGKYAIKGNEFFRQMQLLANFLIAGKYKEIPPMVATILARNVTASPVESNDYLTSKIRLAMVAGVLAEGIEYKLHSETSASMANRLRAADSVNKINSVAAEVFDSLAKYPDRLSGFHLADKAAEFIALNYSDANLSVDAICAETGVSKQYLAKLFREKLGTTMLDFLNYHRIRKAKELLEDENLTIAKISFAVGYVDTHSFSRNFQKYEGILPSMYRESATQKKPSQ